jgi:putative ABC transport system permease protein
MGIVALALTYLRSRLANTLLNCILLAIGVATVTLLLLVNDQLTRHMTREARGIDLVVGAKGSPLQLVLAGVYHLDVPPGNVPLAEVEGLRKNPQIKRVVPLALGDTFNGHRIVGTSTDILGFQEARILRGRLWKEPFEAVIGVEVARRQKVDIGAKIVGTHGLGVGGDPHDGAPYNVVGVLSPTGTALDGLVFTSMESVWLQHIAPTKDEKPAEILAALRDDEKDATLALVQYASPLAAASLPRAINASARLQAASPAYESARLARMLGVGLEVLRVFAVILMLAAALSIFIALYNALEERRYDIAVMRMMGATPKRMFAQVLVEGLIVAVIGAALGLLLGHIATEILGSALAAQGQPRVTGFGWRIEEAWLFLAALGIGLVAALIPAWRAYRRDVALTLSEAQ